jgi:hypothetical protein
MREARSGPKRFARGALLGVWIFLIAAVIAVASAAAAASASQQAKGSAGRARGECIAANAQYTSFHCYDAGSLRHGTGGDDDEEEGDDDDDGPGSACADAHPSCEEWSDRGECGANPGYMLSQCPRSCEACVNGHAGVTQVAPAAHDDDDAAAGHDHRRRVLRRIGRTRAYVRDKLAMGAAQHLLRACRNADPLCAHRASLGECEASPNGSASAEAAARAVQAACPAACRRC